MTTPYCQSCHGLRYIIALRSEDGMHAIERCDECSEDVLSDEDAAQLARRDGISCYTSYPCYLHDQESMP